MKSLLIRRGQLFTLLSIGTMLTGETWAQLTTESIVVNGDIRTFLQYLPTNFSSQRNHAAGLVLSRWVWNGQ